MKSYKYKIIAILFCLNMLSCSDRLDEEVFSELSPTTLFTTEQGISSLMNSAYTYAHRSGAVAAWAPYHMGTMTTGETWGAGGSIEELWVQYINYTWTSNHDHFLTMWNTYYNSIRDANLVLANLENEAFSNTFIQITEAEVHFLRGWCYSELYKLFGRVPLYKTPTDDPLQPRASEEEVRNFIEQELIAAVETLPLEPEAFGKASKGIALAVLSKYYLNTKQWENASDTAKKVIDLDQYTLLSNYSDVFAIENEGNAELIWTLPKLASSGTASNLVNALIFPPAYPRPFSNNAVYAARTYLFDEFVNSFEATDTRVSQIITEYSLADGTVVEGLGNDQTHPYKLPWDPNAVGPNAGNDIPVIRYSDILLTRAEALNESSGPSQEVIDLINQVRNRANASPLTLSDFTKNSLRDIILREREWEFYFEGNSREDQIRHGVMISRAQSRGKNAQDFHILFPIPQTNLDANPVLEQNPGY
ncbi:RagB/SusD family nutrient uptake outer membrane protein [Cytophaga sp. FL35]|uniref:RagB/SusD family nutrient uptake outer membrane protein n=1 Tax=Cytophaga sp. FL35 TaxID=1904456 RepID=UPI001653AD5F|nr:RagB/SusD family nutrient uptake outer membrane protein [Cytophaga sp. FL35]MBC6999630.1 RagB/SusD family nutrient uptake outer membrane protein [Cytophaga sp. FL35]